MRVVPRHAGIMLLVASLLCAVAPLHAVRAATPGAIEFETLVPTAPATRTVQVLNNCMNRADFQFAQKTFEEICDERALVCREQIQLPNAERFSTCTRVVESCGGDTACKNWARVNLDEYQAQVYDDYKRCMNFEQANGTTMLCGVL